jgi:hypothetical protein
MGWKKRSQVFRAMPRRSLLTFLAGVAFLFAGVGVVSDLLNLEHSDPLRFIVAVVLTSLSSVLFALFGSMRMIKSLLTLTCAQILVFPITGRLLPRINRTLPVALWRSQVNEHSALVLGFIVAGYLLFIMFFRLEGSRFFAAHTEIELASTIQRQLVPPISLTTGNLEFYGLSLPSGAVGGDLLDVVQGRGVMCAYIADVAGHGVPAGVLMSMIKTAVRMKITDTPSQGAGLLEALNEVLTPLTDSRSYATFAYVLFTGESQLTFSLAGHLPIFHFQRRIGRLERCSVENLPVAMFSGVRYQTATISFDPGDIVAMVTDGLTEVFNDGGDELGYEYIENALTRSASGPLSEIANQIVHSAAAFGKVTDDRTLLLVRSA